MNKNKGVLYVRVSTTKDEQKSSLEIQGQALEAICKSKNIEIIDTYSDRASGTRIRKRKGFIAMLYDAGIDFKKRNDKSTDDFIINNERVSKFNYIICKDIFRFGRNSSEAMQVIKELKDNGIIVYFVNAGFDTSDKDYKMRLELLFTIAENESHNTSQRIKFSKRHIAQQGRYTPSRLPYGYKRIINDDGIKEIVIDEEQAKIVRFIYDRYKVDGGYSISNILNEQNIPTQQGKKWSDDKIHRIVSNEAYYGSPIVQKWVKDDVTDVHFKKAEKTNQIQLFNVIPAIITKTQFDDLQKIKKQRTNKHTKLGKRVSKNDVFYEKIYCGKCNNRFIRHCGENDKVMYMCLTRRKFTKKECDCKGIAYNSLISIINQCSLTSEDGASNLVYENLINRIDIAKSKVKIIEDEINNKLNEIEEEINMIVKKFITAPPEMELELNKLLLKSKEEKSKLLTQKESLNVKVFDDLLNNTKEKSRFIEKVYSKSKHTFDDKIKLIERIYVESSTVRIQLKVKNYVNEIKEFNKLVSDTELVFPPFLESDLYQVKVFKR